MKAKYGDFTSSQIYSAKRLIQKSIFYLLLYVDPKEKEKYKDVDVVAAFGTLQRKLNGLNSVLLEQPEVVMTISILEAALQEYQSECFNWKIYRKLILDAGAEIMRIEEGDDYDYLQ